MMIFSSLYRRALPNVTRSLHPRVLLAPLYCSFLLLAGCGGNGSNVENVKEQTRGTTNSPQQTTGEHTDPGIPGSDMTKKPFGYSEGGGSQIRAEKIDVALSEAMISMPKTVRAGHLTLNVVNNGTAPQTFTLRAPNINVAPVGALEPGKGTTLTADLQPGTYRVESTAQVEGKNRDLTFDLVVID